MHLHRPSTGGLAVALSLFFTTALAASPWPASARASALDVLSLMSTAQKLLMVAGTRHKGPGVTYNYTGMTPAIPLSDGRVIPECRLHDGPQGVANNNLNVTQWPAALTVVQVCSARGLSLHTRGGVSTDCVWCADTTPPRASRGTLRSCTHLARPWGASSS